MMTMTMTMRFSGPSDMFAAYMSETEAGRRHESSGVSDTESVASDSGRSTSRRLAGRSAFSEAEASDFEAPQRAPEKTLGQSVMEALKRGPRRKPPTVVLVQPGETKRFEQFRETVS